MDSLHSLSILFINIEDLELIAYLFPNSTKQISDMNRIQNYFWLTQRKENFFNKQVIDENQEKLSEKKTRDDCKTWQTEKFIGLWLVFYSLLYSVIFRHFINFIYFSDSYLLRSVRAIRTFHFDWGNATNTLKLQ